MKKILSIFCNKFVANIKSTDSVTKRGTQKVEDRNGSDISIYFQIIK